MNNNAVIRVTSKRDADEDIELVTEGGFYFKNDAWYIIYEENEEMGMADCSVMIKVKSDEVVVTRKGSFSSKMIYKTGVTNEFLYHMPYGNMSIILTTHEIDFSFDDNGGELNLVYFLSVHEGDVENILNIKVNRVDGY